MLSCKFIMASGGESVVDLLFFVGVRHSSGPVCLLENNLTVEYSLVPPVANGWIVDRSPGASNGQQGAILKGDGCPFRFESASLSFA